MHSWIHYKDFCLTMKNSGGQFFPLHAITCSADNEMEDWHPHISTWKAQLKDQELLDPPAWWPLCTPGWNPSANTQIQVVIARKCNGREPEAARTLRWIRCDEAPPKSPHCSNSVKELLVPCPAPRHPDLPWQWKWSDCTSSKMSFPFPLLKIFL